jgi:cytochrome c biogenesis protein CcdA
MTAFLIVGALSVAGLELFLALKVPARIAEMARVARDSVRVLASASLSDAEKEIAARQGSLELMRATLAFLARFLLVCLVGYAGYLLVVRFLPQERDPIHRLLVSPMGLVALTIAVAGYLRLRHAVRQQL